MTMLSHVSLALSLVAALLSLVRSSNINRRLQTCERLLHGTYREGDR
jgi:hypothetical protein